MASASALGRPSAVPRRFRRGALLLLLAWCVLHPFPAHGQEGAPRFWGGIGVGTGSARVSCDICNNDREAGMSGSAALGFGVGRRVRVGVEGNAWRDDDGNRETLLWSGGLTTYLYPAGDRAFWTKMGAGVMRYRAETDRDDIQANTFGVIIGAGYDIPMNSRLAVGPYATLAASSRADLTSGGRTVRERVSHSLLHVGVVFHTR